MQAAAQQLREDRSGSEARATTESDAVPSGRLREGLPSDMQKRRPQGRAAVSAAKMAREQPPFRGRQREAGGLLKLVPKLLRVT